jgi:hypothetical protein
MKLTTRIGNWRLGLIVKPFFFKTMYVSGVTSDVYHERQGLHVLFWDFEEKNYRKIYNELKRVQRKYHLGDIHIYQSGKRPSYRAVCMDIVPLKKMATAIIATRGVDIAFIKWTLIRRAATIRITPKHNEPIVLKQTIKSKHRNLSSLSHSLLFNKLFGQPLPNRLDTGSKLKMVEYETIEKEVINT